MKTRIVILGGGFAGVYTAMELERINSSANEIEVILVNKENYFVFQPMLPEIISGSIGILDTVSPLRRLLPKTTIYVRDVEMVDIANKTVTLSHGFRPRPLVISFDHLVIAVGNVTDFRGLTGLKEHALPFKNLADAIHLRNHVIHLLEEAAIEEDQDLERQLLTFVIAGGGFSGVEVAAELNDFVRKAARHYHGVDEMNIRVILLHSGKRILDKEMSEGLSLYAQKILQQRGVEIKFNSRLQSASPDSAILNSGERIPTKTLVSTVPSSPNPIVDLIDLPKEKGKIKVTTALQVEGTTNIWAIGDCALIPTVDRSGSCPPTAQYASREGTLTAQNIIASIRGEVLKPFTFRGLGKMGALGHRNAVAEIFAGIKLSGFLAWFLWRTVYLFKLPGLERKIKVGIAWALDLLIPTEFVQLKLGTTRGVSQSHFEPGETVFRQGDVGDTLYILLNGEAEVIREEIRLEQRLALLSAGEFFGEMALLNEHTRGATIRCTKAMDVLCLNKNDFRSLVANLPDLRKSFESVMSSRNIKK
ncbi:MAG: FAD-dependent oxidoreductase [Bacteroidota bacterium]